MFETNSRYADIENSTLYKDGRMILYKKRRFIPNKEMLLLGEVTVSAGDRLDQITSRTLGDPEQFWHICDANNVMHPLELTSEIKRIKIPLPGR